MVGTEGSQPMTALATLATAVASVASAVMGWLPSVPTHNPPKPPLVKSRSRLSFPRPRHARPFGLAQLQLRQPAFLVDRQGVAHVAGEAVDEVVLARWASRAMTTMLRRSESAESVVHRKPRINRATSP